MEKMNRAESLFRKMLVAGLWDRKVDISEFADADESLWKEVLRIARATGTMGIVADGLEIMSADGKLHGLSEKQLTNLAIIKLKLMQQHGHHNAVIFDVSKMLGELGHETFLLKGQGVAMNYTHPESRSCGDIDLYIGEETIDDLVLKLKNRGITCDEEINDTERHVVFFHENVNIELHRFSTFMNLPKADRIYQRWWTQGAYSPKREMFFATADGRMLREKDGDAATVYVPAPEHNAFFLFSHALCHYTSLMVQFRQFCDIARYLHTHREIIDRDVLGDMLGKLDMMYPWQVVGNFLHDYLDTPEEDIPFYEPSLASKGEAFADRLRRKVLYPLKKRIGKPKGRIGGKVYTYLGYYLDLADVMKVFPKEALKNLWHTTVLGTKLLFRTDNRTSGTFEHYMERTRNNNNK